MKKFAIPIIILIFLIIFFSENSAQREKGRKRADPLKTPLQTNDSLKAKLFKAKADTNKVNILNRISAKLYELNSDSALLCANQALELSKLIKWENGIANANCNIGNILLLKYKFNEAKQYFENAIEIGNKINNWEIIGNSLIGIGNSLSGKKDYNGAANKFNLAKGKFQVYNDFAGECLVNQNFGKMCQKFGKNDSALVYFQKALNIAEKNNDKQNISKVYGYIGNIHIIKSDFSTALEFFQKALKIDLEIGNKKGIIDDYTNIGVFYISIYTMPEALKNFEKALKLAKELGDIRSTGRILRNMGIATEKSSGSYETKIRDSKLQEALKLYETSLKIAIDLEDKSSIGLSLERLGNINYWLNNNQKALTYFENANMIYEEIGSKFEIASIIGKLGVMYIVIASDSTNNFNDSIRKNYIIKAFDYVKTSVELNKKLESYDQLRTNYSNLTNMYSQIGDSNNAFKSETELNRITNKMFQLNKLVEIAKIEKEYELELLQKKYENENLKVQFQLQKSELERKNVELKNLNGIQQIQKLELEKNVNKFTILEKDKEIQSILIKQKDIEAEKKIAVINRKNDEKNYKIGIAIVFFLFGLLLLFFWRMKKNNKTLQAKNEIISDTNIELDYLNSALSLKNAEIEIVNQYLTESNASKDKFFSIIAHDLKNPLTAMISGSGLLLDYYNIYDDEKRLKHIEKLKTSSNYLYKMLENLLLWARSQTNNIEFSPKENSINSVIKDNVELLKLNLNDKQINISFNSTEDIHANFDKNMITTVVRNLLSNAIKFTQIAGSIEIEVKSKPPERLVSSEGYIEVSIKDTGIGIPKTNLEKLFRIDKTITTPGTKNEEGTGLGLILCHEFVEKHGGKIWVESQVGKGSTFWFTIPKLN